tara:strand:- start:217 stop:1017 length:801 start_codon:yes stop_codon:yes gene_type:complete
MNNIRTAVILCGGKGTRLGSLGKNTPKTLVKIQGKQILWYILKNLKLNGFNHVILPLGYKGNLIRKFISKHEKIIDHIDLINTGTNTNIGKRLSIIKEKVKSKNFLLLNGDAIFDFNLNKIIINHEKKNSDLTFISSEITYPYGTIGLKNNKVIDFKRNLVYEALLTRNQKNYIAYNYSGMSVINTKKFVKSEKNFLNSKNFEKEFFPFFIKRYKTNLIKLSGFWHSIDNMKDILAVNDKKESRIKYLLLSKIKKKFFQKKEIFNE